MTPDTTDRLAPQAKTWKRTTEPEYTPTPTDYGFETVERMERLIEGLLAGLGEREK